MKNADVTGFLIVCRAGRASVAPFRAVGIVAKVPIHVSHSIEDAENMLAGLHDIWGVVIDTHFAEWHAAVMLLRRLRPDVFVVIFGDPQCPDVSCANAVIADRNLLALLDLMQVNTGLRATG